MAFVLKDPSNSGKNYIACFDETSEDQFQLIVTDFTDYFSEKLTMEVLMNRTCEMNESIQFSKIHVLKALREGKPEVFEIKETESEDHLRLDLKFQVNLKTKSRSLNLFFNISKNSIEAPKSFTIALMKLAIDSGSMITKMRKALEAKDLEIDDYKSNGATLIRESLATPKFDFDQLRNQQVKLPEDSFKIDSTALCSPEILPELCGLIKAENLQKSCDKTKFGSEADSSRKNQKQAKVRNNRSRTIIPALKKKDFEYDDDELDEEMNEVSVIQPSSSSTQSTQSKTTKKPKFVL